MKFSTYSHFYKEIANAYSDISEDLETGIITTDEAKKMIEWTNEQAAMLEKIKEFEGLE